MTEGLTDEVGLPTKAFALRSAQELVTVDEEAPALGDEGELVGLGRCGAVLARESEVDRSLRGGGVRVELVDRDSPDCPPEAVIAGAAACGPLHCPRQLTPGTAGAHGDVGVVRLYKALKLRVGVQGGHGRDSRSGGSRRTGSPRRLGLS